MHPEQEDPPFDAEPQLGEAVEVVDGTDLVEAAPPQPPTEEAFNAVALLGPLQRLQQKFEGVLASAPVMDLGTAAGEAAARLHRRKLVRIRNEAAEAYTDANKPILDAQRRAREVRDTIIATVQQFEKPWDDAITALDAKREAERKERERIAAEKRRALEGKVDAMRTLVVSLADASSDDILQAAADLRAIEVTEDAFGDLHLVAADVRTQVLQTLDRMQLQALDREARAAEHARVQSMLEEERKRMAEDAEKLRAELAKQRKDMEAERNKARLEREELERKLREHEAAEAERKRAEESARQAIETAQRQAAEASAREAAEKARAEQVEAERKQRELNEQRAQEERKRTEQIAQLMVVQQQSSGMLTSLVLHLRELLNDELLQRLPEEFHRTLVEAIKTARTYAAARQSLHALRELNDGND